jgi:hypothetical protein
MCMNSRGGHLRGRPGTRTGRGDVGMGIGARRGRAWDDVRVRREGRRTRVDITHAATCYSMVDLFSLREGRSFSSGT